MLKSSLLEILRTFSKQELTKFEDFVRSPYFNKKENVLKLFLEIKKYAPDFYSEKLGKERVWEALFSHKEYNYGIMKNVIFDLNKLLERYIIVTKCESDIISESKYLLEYLNEKNLTKLFVNKCDSIERAFDVDYYTSSNYGLNMYYDFCEAMAIVRVNMMKNPKINDNAKENYSLYSVLNFLINSFKVYQNLVVDNNNINKNFEDNLTAYFLKQISLKSFDGILENVKRVSDTDYLHLKVYLKMYLMFRENSPDNYLIFKNSLFENIKMFSKRDLRNLHFCLISGIDLVANSDINFSAEKLTVFDSMISLNILTENNGVMSEHIFIYYVSLSFKEFDIERINKFSKTFSGKLKEDIQSNALKYVEAIKLFMEEKYEDSLNIVSQIETNYFTMKLYLKYIRGRCIYKIGDYELFLNDYDSVMHFIKNNEKLNNRLKILLEKNYYFLKLLFKLRIKYDVYEYANCKNEIMEFYKNEKSWFLKELTELEIMYSKN